jgi:hypothetical protein
MKSKEEKHLKGTENTITTQTCDSRDQNTLKRHATKARKRMLHKQNQKNMHKVLVTTTISPKTEHQDASSRQESDKKRSTKRHPRDNSNPPPTQRNCTNFKPYVKEGFHNPNNFNSATIKVVFFFFFPFKKFTQFFEIEKLAKLCTLSNLHENFLFPKLSILFCERNNKFCQKNKNMSYNSSQL